MAISKGFRYKDKEGKVTDYEYGVNGSNVTQDSEHRLVTDEEKQTWNDKADLEDIPSGSAASHAVANNCTTTQAGSVLDARQGKVLMDKANRLISDLGGCRFGYTADGLPGYKKEGADTVYPFKNGGYLAIMVNSHTSYIDNTTAVISINCSRKIEDDISFHDNENGFPITFNKQGRYRIRYTYLHGMNITVKLLQNDNLIHTISSPTRNVEYFYDINAEVGDKFSMTYTTSQTAVWFDCLITIEKI